MRRRLVAVSLEIAGLLLITGSVAFAHGSMPEPSEIGPPMALGFVIFVSSFLVMLLAPPDVLGLPEEDDVPAGIGEWDR